MEIDYGGSVFPDRNLSQVWRQSLDHSRQKVSRLNFVLAWPLQQPGDGQIS